MILMLPLGIAYFTVTVTGLAVGLGMVASPLWAWFGRVMDVTFVREGITHHWSFPAWSVPLMVVGGAVVLLAMMHLIREMGRFQAWLAKLMLVRLAK
jgi:hypothetical protein